METKPKFLKWSLIIGIIIVLNLFLNYSISLFYKEPDYNAYFPQQQVVEPITTKEACLKVGGQWSQSLAPTGALNKDGSTQVSMNSYCDPNFTKQKEFSDAQKKYQKNIFIILVALGVISLLVGVFSGNEILILGFSWGGVLSLLIAAMRYWSTAGNVLKLLILALALSVLIWLALKKFGKQL